jgi:hypothetical protein
MRYGCRVRIRIVISIEIEIKVPEKLEQKRKGIERGQREQEQNPFTMRVDGLARGTANISWN